MDSHIGKLKMTILEMCGAWFKNIESNFAFTPSVIRLCKEHNLELTEELKNSDELFKSTFTGNRVDRLFGKPVIEDTYRNKPKCIVCDYISFYIEKDK